MKPTIAQFLKIKKFPFEIKDSNGNRIYFEDSDKFWVKREYDDDGNENSYGYIEDNRLKKITPNLKKFNINDNIYIQITEKGWKHLKETVGDEYIKHCIDPYKTTIDGETWYKLQCWSVFDLLPTRMGHDLLFSSNIMIDFTDPQ